MSQISERKENAICWFVSLTRPIHSKSRSSLLGTPTHTTQISGDAHTDILQNNTSPSL